MHEYTSIVPYVMGIATLLFGAMLVLIPHLISPRSRGAEREATYESGEQIIGGAWVQFHSYYYMYALVFVAFDVETAFIVPCYSALRSLPGAQPMVEILVFLVVLTLSLIYALRKKVLEWI